MAARCCSLLQQNSTNKLCTRAVSLSSRHLLSYMAPVKLLPVLPQNHLYDGQQWPPWCSIQQLALRLMALVPQPQWTRGTDHPLLLDVLPCLGHRLHLALASTPAGLSSQPPWLPPPLFLGLFTWGPSGLRSRLSALLYPCFLTWRSHAISGTVLTVPRFIPSAELLLLNSESRSRCGLLSPLHVWWQFQTSPPISIPSKPVLPQPFASLMAAPSFCVLNPKSFESFLTLLYLSHLHPSCISITPDMQMTPPLWQKVKKNQGYSVSVKWNSTISYNLNKVNWNYGIKYQ